MEEKEQSKESYLLVFENKIDNLTVIVSEIKDNLANSYRDIEQLKMDMVGLRAHSEQCDKDLDKLTKRIDASKTWIMGIASGVIVAVVIAILKSFSVF